MWPDPAPTNRSGPVLPVSAGSLTAHAAGVDFGRAQDVQPGVGILLAHIAHLQPDCFLAPPATATPGQQEQVAVLNPSHAVAADQQQLQRFEHHRWGASRARFRLDVIAPCVLLGARFSSPAPQLDCPTH